MNYINNLNWYFNRLKRMTAGEVLHRSKCAIRDLADQLDSSTGRTPDRPERLRLKDFRIGKGLLPELTWDMVALDADRTDLLSSNVSYGGHSWRWIDQPQIWHVAERGVWKSDFHTKMNCRSGNPNGDARLTWETNRLQHLIGLALIARISPHDRAEALTLLKAQVSSWIRCNPVSIGINYVSAMECALRILSIAFAAHVAREFFEEEDGIWFDLETLVKSHASFVCGHLSLGSSLGNHTVAEASGLYVAGLILSGGDADHWRKRGLDVLRLACGKEFLSDGGGAEQSPSYHSLILDLLYIVMRTARHHGCELLDIEDLHSMGSAYLRRICMPEGLPQIGDDDSSHSLSKYMLPSWRHDGVAETNQILETNPETGISICRIGDASILFDHGPLGMKPNFAHGHADALSMLMSINGRQVLVDSGTYTYSNSDGWRNYFRSAAAHNTLHGSSADQATSKGAFLWSDPPDVRLVHSINEGARVLLCGEMQRRNRYVHRRAISFDGRFLVVVDKIWGIEPSAVRLRWHFDGKLECAGEEFRLAECPGLSVSLPDCEARIFRGSMHPRAGWRSREYGQIEEASTLEARFPSGSSCISSVFLLPASGLTDPTALTSEMAELQKLLQR